MVISQYSHVTILIPSLFLASKNDEQKIIKLESEAQTLGVAYYRLPTNLGIYRHGFYCNYISILRQISKKKTGLKISFLLHPRLINALMSLDHVVLKVDLGLKLTSKRSKNLRKLQSLNLTKIILINSEFCGAPNLIYIYKRLFEIPLVDIFLY